MAAEKEEAPDESSESLSKLGELWSVGALSEETAEARREMAQTGLSEYLELGRELSRLGNQEKEIAARKAVVLQRHKTLVADMVKQKILSPGKVYLLDDKAVVVNPVAKKNINTGKSEPSYEVKVMEIA